MNSIDLYDLMLPGVMLIGGTGFLIVLLVLLIWILIIYLFITAWLNIKCTRVNTDRIVELLSDIYNRNNGDSEGEQNQEEATYGSSEQSENDTTVDKSIKNYDGWWVKLNPPTRQPLPKNMNFDGTTTDPAEAINNPRENGDKIETDFDIIPKEKWWNKKIF